MMRGGLSRKLMVPYLILLALLMAVMGNLIWAAKQERDALERATESIKHQSNLLMEIGALRREAQRAILSYRFDGNETHLNTLRRLEPQFDQLYAELREGASSKREAALADMVQSTRRASGLIRGALIRAIRQGDEREARLVYNRWIVHSRKLEALLADLTALNVKALDQEVARMDRARGQAIGMAGVMVLLTGLVLIVFAFLSRRQFIKPLIEMTRSAKAIAAGNLSRRVGGSERTDEIGVLAGAFNEMTASLAAAKRELEERMAELGRSNEDLQQFAYVSSHDLKEPLRMVSLYAQLLERDYSDKLDDEARQQIHYITEGARRMQGLIDDLLLYSKVTGQREPFQPVDCSRLLTTVREDLKVRIEETGTRLELGELPVVNGNPTLLLQLFENLVSNAIKFHGDRPPHIRVSCREEDGLWIFSVADNGIGIPPEYWDRIFVIFHRLHSREEISGSGIGLAICRNIVERHGGTIWVESVPGQGSTFSFSLPREARAATAPRRPETPREAFPH